MTDDILLTDQDIARMAKIPVASVRWLRRMGKIPYVKVGRHPRIWLSDFYRTYKKPDVKIVPAAGDIYGGHHA